ncbi:MAG: ABC transporter ATP-binding protein [Planctomycetes bacterium]|nr:ABC transporter ATP-binding protein [Planctomycetota bacterium]
MAASFDQYQDFETLGKAFDARLLRRLLPFTRPDLAAFALGLALLFVITGLELLGPLILRHAIDGPVREGVAAAERAPHLRALCLLAGLFLVVAALTLLARYQQLVVLNGSGQRVLNRVRCAAFSHLQRLPVAFFDRNSTGRLVTRVTTDVETLNELLTSGAVTLIGDVVKILVFLAAVFFINPALALIALLSVPVLAAAAAYFRGRALSAYRETRSAIARVNSYLGETIAGVTVLQGCAREDKAFSVFAAHNRSFLRANLRTVLYFALFFPVVDGVSLAIQGGVFWRGGLDILGARLTIGEFLQFWYYLNFIFEPLRELAERYNVLQSAMASAERIFKVLDTPPEAADAAHALAAEKLSGRVAFEDVHFAYRAGEPVLDGVSFSVQPGETVALVGATGGGKTTVTALLNRFYEPLSGRITIDGADIRAYRRASLRAALAYVPQDVFLFTGTVLDNLMMGGPAVTREQAMAAARAIGAERIIQRLPDGYEQRLAERGANLSAGERQILSFARALAVDPAILILDEATANVDPETEEEIQRAIRKLLAGRTSIVVAHRLSTIRQAARILVLHRGRIREEGTHQELLARGGLYAALYHLQFAVNESPGRGAGEQA